MVRVLFAGATGLVGRAATVRLLGRDDVDLTCLIRQASGAPYERQISFETLLREGGGALDGVAADVGVCCLGTTLKIAGSPDAFRRVDHDHVLAFALAAKTAGAARFILMSSVGAKAASANFYLCVKGETEAAVSGVGFDRLDILRPGVLLGHRREKRPGERAAGIASRLLWPLLVGPAAKYRAIHAYRVADAISALVDRTESGRFIHHTPDIERLAVKASP